MDEKKEIKMSPTYNLIQHVKGDENPMNTSKRQEIIRMDESKEVKMNPTYSHRT